MDARKLFTTLSLLRTGVGLVFLGAAEPVLRMIVPSEDRSGALTVFAQTVGVRDLVLGLGSLRAASAEDGVEPWMVASLASDAIDLVVGLRSSRRLGRARAAIAMLAPAPFVAFGAMALVRHRAARVQNASM